MLRSLSRFALGAAVVFSLGLWLGPPAFAQGEVDPPLPDGTEAAHKQLAGFRVPAGLKVTLFAAEPQLHSPVALCLDEQGRVYVTEEYRFNRGTEENRTRPFFLEDDLQIRTLDDRLAMYRKHAAQFVGGMDWFTKFTDRVVRLVDQDGDGKAEQATVFADGFNGVLDGMAAGVIARDGAVYATVIPNLWRLRDADGDGKAETREAILTGFGVNAGFLGHDLHGLLWGTDGKLYFTIGDRGFSVTTKEGKTLAEPRRGAIFRCNPDGTEFEVVHRGLRNPQEIALDDQGDIFAADNNCDKGDHSRLVWMVEGGDSGWNMAYQTIAAPYLTGPWHAEKIWHLQSPAEQPAHITPPIAKLGAGPCGFAYDNGLGLPERYRGHFFMCNYTGGGGIETFALKRKGASFESTDEHDFFKPINATDCDFGYDGRMYVSDFVNLDWSGKSKGGRVYTIGSPELLADPRIAAMTEMFRVGFKERSPEELLSLLVHADQRVRLRAQFALAEHGPAVVAALTTAAAKLAEERLPRLGRLHAIWALGQIGRKTAPAAEGLRPLLKDADAEVRTQAAKTLGTLRDAVATNDLIALLADDDDRVKFHAATALGKLKAQAAVEPLFALVQTNANKDAYLRHAAVFALAEIKDEAAVRARIVAPDAAVRLAALLVLRKWSDPAPFGSAGDYSSDLAKFLLDADPAIVTEAARAINDLHLDAANDSLAALAESLASATAPLPEALVRRVIQANFRAGRPTTAAALAQLAGAPHTSLPMKREALAALADWATPAPRDRVTGYWRPQAPRDVALIRAALEPHVPRLFAALPTLQPDLTQLIQKLALKADDETFFTWLDDPQRPVATRVAALQYLAGRKHERLAQGIETALAAQDSPLRIAGRDALAARDAPRTFELVRDVIRDSEQPLVERQRAFFTLAGLKTADADAELVRWVEGLAARRLQDSAVEIDVLEAAAARETPEFAKARAHFEEQRGKENPNWRFEATLTGGDAERGRALFIGHAQAQCVRCHKVDGVGGDVGPDLSRLGAKVDRRQFLQSLLEPDAMISPGFGLISVELADGNILSGVLKKENDDELEIVTPDGRRHTIPQKEVEQRTNAKSPMPAMGKILSPREVRDLIEFLGTRK